MRDAITEIPREPAFAAISEETRPEATRILPERSIPARSACPAIRSIVLCRPISSANRRSRSPSQAPAEWIPPLPRYASDARASASIAEKSDSGETNGPAEGSWTGRPAEAGTWKLIPAPHPEVKVGVMRSGTSPRIRTDGRAEVFAHAQGQKIPRGPDQSLHPEETGHQEMQVVGRGDQRREGDAVDREGDGDLPHREMVGGSQPAPVVPQHAEGRPRPSRRLRAGGSFPPLEPFLPGRGLPGRDLVHRAIHLALLPPYTISGGASAPGSAATGTTGRGVVESSQAIGENDRSSRRGQE